MRFRPCIDIHNGRVKQIVGGSLADVGDRAYTNFESEYEADYYARLYKKDHIRGGHVILLNQEGSSFYEKTKTQAVKALQAYPQGLQVGGGITEHNAEEYLEYGASHVIVTSYVFQDGHIHRERLKRLNHKVGKEHIVLDLSCRKKEGAYYIVTNRWQTFTEEPVTLSLMEELRLYCDEFLVHGVDVEGKSSGVEVDLVRLLAQVEGISITYAGGIGSMEDLEEFRAAGQGKLDFTIGSALDLFGGNIPYEVVNKM